MQLTNDVGVFMYACVQTVDTSNKCYNKQEAKVIWQNVQAATGQYWIFIPQISPMSPTMLENEIGLLDVIGSGRGSVR